MVAHLHARAERTCRPREPAARNRDSSAVYTTPSSRSATELVHATRRLQGLPSIDWRSKPLFEFEPPPDRIAEDLGPVDVPDAGHPSLRRGVDFEAYDFHDS